MKNTTLISFIAISTLLFCLAIAVDFSPYLRGPSYYPPEWRWSYLFQNTLGRVYVPLFILALIFIAYFITEKKKIVKTRNFVLLVIVLVLLFFFFQLGMLYFSRSGIGVLVHRIINPEINGYFTAALSIHSVADFLRNYNDIMLTFVYHAKAHPPGAILLFYYVNQAASAFSLLVDWAAQQAPSTPDVKLIWESLKSSEKAGVFLSAFLIPLLSTLSIIPLYFTAKLLYGVKTAYRSIFLFIVIPSLIFFIPINDAFLHLFSITAFCFFVYGLQKNKWMPLIVSGIILFVGILFNLSLLPVLVLFFVYFLIVEAAAIKKHLSSVIRRGIYFVLGLIIPFLLLFIFFQFNFIQVTMTIMKHVPDIHTRSYFIWIFYNLYDFFIFTGIPVAGVYLFALKTTLGNFSKKLWKKVDPVLIAFTIMILVLNFSGSVRGETARLWIPFLPFIVLIVSSFMTNTLKISTKAFAVILLLQVVQILVMQEFWVMLW